MFPGGRPCSLGWQEAQPCTERLLMNCAPCITRLFSGHLSCPVPEKGASGTEYPFRTGKACFLHRMHQKMRRVPQEPVFCTARIFRTVGGPLRYRMPPGHQTSPIRIPPNTTTQHNAQTKPSITTLSPQPSTTQHPHPATTATHPATHPANTKHHPASTAHPNTKRKKSRLNVTSIGTSEKRQLPTLPPGGAVPSALVSLTSLFGMGRGGSSPL